MFELTKRLALAAVAVISMTAGAAQAATLYFYNDAATKDTLRFTLSCTGQCKAWNGSAFSAPDGDLFPLANNGEALEISTVNSITGESYADLTKTSMGGASSATFTTSAEYLLIKIGKSPDNAVIQNLSAGNIYTFTQVGKGAGFSHVSEFGGSPVPIPASLPLLLTALGTGVLIRRRGFRRA